MSEAVWSDRHPFNWKSTFGLIRRKKIRLLWADETCGHKEKQTFLFEVYSRSSIVPILKWVTVMQYKSATIFLKT